MADQIDTKVIGKLAEILDQHGLTELEYEADNCRICLTKDSMRPVMAQQPIITAQPVVAAPQATVPAPEKAGDEEKAEAVDDETKNPNAVKSPMVGVVYLAPDNTKPNYVKVGSLVAEGDTVCLIEAMKTFNPVKAHKGGRVTKILIENGDPVEYGQPLVIIE